MKPREFWITMEFPGPHLSIENGRGAFLVREVVPIDWEKVWSEFKGTMALKDYLQIEKLVEKQLRGEE